MAMNIETQRMTKNNVRQFDSDVMERGSYAYTTERLSARTANGRISRSIAEAYDFTGKTVLDLGCGDGAYTVEFPALGVREIVGVDPASVAIDAATARAEALGLGGVVRFETGNIYALDDYLADRRFDCIVLRGVLHHLPDPARAIAGLSAFQGTILIVEPNGNNPVLKMLERYSRYHIEHEERSFSPALIRRWLASAGFDVLSSRVVNLVPFFCPDWMVSLLHTAERPVERLPLLRDIACGQSVIVARKPISA
jgi:2-polyprenyl-3-methyl-5-hydroxy-6-metoxy-1,4-benzoquinol methylase